MTHGPSGDAFGEALADFHFGREAQTLILETDSGQAHPAMPPAWFFQTEGQWHPWEREVLSQVAGPVLDLGCGAGRASIYVASRGLDVTAVDHSAGAITVCRDRGVLDARLGDLTDPPTDRPWQTVLLLCGNLGLGGDWTGCRGLLERLGEITADDAVLIGDTVDPTAGDVDPEYQRYQDRQVAHGHYRGLVGLRLRYGETVGDFWAQSNFRVADIPALIDGTPWQLSDHHIDGVEHYVMLTKRPRTDSPT